MKKPVLTPIRAALPVYVEYKTSNGVSMFKAPDGRHIPVHLLNRDYNTMIQDAADGKIIMKLVVEPVENNKPRLRGV